MRIAALLALALPAGAAAQLYQPAQVCETRVHEPVTVTYQHPLTGLPRTVDVIVEEPLGLSEPMPAIVWMHGGAGGGTPEALAEWRGVTARACYLSVTIGHPWPEPEQARALCAWLGRKYPDDCGAASQGQVKLLNVERPLDLRAVLDYLLEEWQGRVDPERIAAGGHSAGAGAALMTAGAARQYEAKVERFADPRPRAFLAFSPQAPGSDGFFQASWEGVARPTLIGTGAGDTTGGEKAADRLKVFEHLPEPDKYLLYLNDGSPHGRFGLGRSRCVSTGGTIPEADCDRAVERLAAVAVAFLDAYVRERPQARAWLRSDSLAEASDGAARMRSK